MYKLKFIFLKINKLIINTLFRYVTAFWASNIFDSEIISVSDILSFFERVELFFFSFFAVLVSIFSVVVFLGRPLLRFSLLEVDEDEDEDEEVEELIFECLSLVFFKRLDEG